MKTRACSLAQSIATPESKVLSNALSATSSHTGNWVKHSSSNDVFVQKGGVPSKIRWLSVYFHWHCHVLGKFGVNHLFLDPNGHQLLWCCGSASQQLRTAGAAKAQPGFLGPARSKSYTFQFEVTKYGYTWKNSQRVGLPCSTYYYLLHSN